MLQELRNTRPEVRYALDGLVKETLKNGGFTRHAITGHAPQTGFVVSPYPERSAQIDIDKLTILIIRDYVDANSDLLAKNDHYVGGWVDDDTVYLDISIVTPNKPRALKLAVEHEQLAVWDLEKNEETRIECVA